MSATTKKTERLTKSFTHSNNHLQNQQLLQTLHHLIAVKTTGQPTKIFVRQKTSLHVRWKKSKSDLSRVRWPGIHHRIDPELLFFMRRNDAPGFLVVNLDDQWRVLTLHWGWINVVFTCRGERNVYVFRWYCFVILRYNGEKGYRGDLSFLTHHIRYGL